MNASVSDPSSSCSHANNEETADTNEPSTVKKNKKFRNFTYSSLINSMTRHGNTISNTGSSDIRNFMSPTPLSRRRRIVESDSSANSDERNQSGHPEQNANLPVASIQVEGDENDPPQPEAIHQRDPPRNESPHATHQLIEVLDSDSSDSMYVPLRRPLSEMNRRGHREQPIPQSENLQVQQSNALRPRLPTPQQQRQLTPQQQPQQQLHSTPQRQRQSTPQRQRQSTPQRQRQSTPQRRRQSSPPRQRRRFDAEAESTSEEDSSQESADESDENAAELYRAAIMGVRNRPIAAQQVIC
jgi:hypothetical protein